MMPRILNSERMGRFNICQDCITSTTRQDRMANWAPAGPTCNKETPSRQTNLPLYHLFFTPDKTDFSHNMLNVKFGKAKKKTVI